MKSARQYGDIVRAAMSLVQKDAGVAEIRRKLVPIHGEKGVTSAIVSLRLRGVLAPFEPADRTRIALQIRPAVADLLARVAQDRGIQCAAVARKAMVLGLQQMGAGAP